MPWASLAATAARHGRTLLLFAAAACLPACDDDDPTGPMTPTVSGVVTGYDGALAGAVVRIGDVADTTGADGSYLLTDLEPGMATLHCTAPGYEDFQMQVPIPSAGVATRNFALDWAELVEVDAFTLFVPGPDATAAILLTLGGPDTRGFPAGTPFGAPLEAVELSLQALGEAFRTLAGNHGFAILGTSMAGMPNSPESDDLLFDVIEEVATRSGLPALTTAPLLLYGMSGGAAQASGLAVRNPGRVAGAFLKVPAGLEPLAGGESLGIPTYLVQAEMDTFVDNEAIGGVYRDYRGVGAPWALALEPGVPHHSLSPRQRDLTVNWMAVILGLRLNQGPGDPILAIVESAGWVGDPTTLDVSPFAEYAGDPRDASWFPSQATAEEWEVFVRGGASQQ